MPKVVKSLAKKRQEKYTLIQPGPHPIMKLTPGVRGMAFRPYEPNHGVIRWPGSYTQVMAYRIMEVQQHGVAQPRVAVEIGCSFCSPLDAFSELAGREKAITRLDQKQSVRAIIRVSDLVEYGPRELQARWWTEVLKKNREERRRLGVPDTLYRYLEEELGEFSG